MTGATGLVGGQVMETARRAGWEAIGWGHRNVTAGVHPVDLRDGAAVAAAFADAAPDAVVHCAYSKDDPAVTVDGTAHVAAQCARTAARLVLLSSDVVFGGTAARRYFDSDRPDPVSAYGRLKLAAEHAVADSGADAVWIRTSLVLRATPPGPNELLALAAATTDPDRPWCFDDETRCPIDVHDLADAVVWALTNPCRGPLHVVGPDLVSRWQLTRRLAAAAGHDWTLVRARPSPEGDRPRHLELVPSSGIPAIRSLDELGCPDPAGRVSSR